MLLTDIDWNTWKPTDRATLLFVVDRSHARILLIEKKRGLGAGKRLLDTAIEWSRAHGGTVVVLDTVEEMAKAIAFYEAHGFVRDDAQVRGSRCTRGYSRRL